ncbi:MAG: DUF1648 domain-containing protein [candidate division Zixibacteria bacterium]|nr:DUF1648 domain-containing protein [candidate division Zixibacteria bacterium]
MKFMEERGVSRWLLIVHVVLLLFLWWIPLQTFSSLPDQIAIHFDSNGQPDRFEPKTGMRVWMVPFIGMVLGLGILILALFPGLYDFPQKDEVKRWPEHLRLPVYALVKEMMLGTLLCVDVIWMLLEYNIVASARAGHAALGAAALWTGVLIPAVIPAVLAVIYIKRITRTVEETKAKASL